MKKTFVIVLVCAMLLVSTTLLSGCYDQMQGIFLKEYELDGITLQSAIEATLALNDYKISKEMGDGSFEEYRVKIEYATDLATGEDVVYKLKGYHYASVKTATAVNVTESWRSNNAEYRLLNDNIALDETVSLENSGYAKMLSTMLSPSVGIVPLDFLKTRIGNEDTGFYIDEKYQESAYTYINEVTATMYFTMSEEDMSKIGRSNYSTIVTVKFKVSDNLVGPINYIHVDELYSTGSGTSATQVNNLCTFRIDTPANIDWSEFDGVLLNGDEEE